VIARVVRDGRELEPKPHLDPARGAVRDRRIVAHELVRAACLLEAGLRAHRRIN
jgi:hypothetical protein